MGDCVDWRCVSQHYCQSLVEEAVEKQQLLVKFIPGILVAVSEDGLTVAHLLKRVLQLKTGSPTGPIILTSAFEIYDDEMNPYQAHMRSGASIKLEGQKIMLVDKVDESRASMSRVLADLQGRIDLQRATAGGAFQEPEIGVFVLHNKKRPKAGDLPPEMMEGRYFAAEESDNVVISFPFSVHPNSGYTQPRACGDHHRPSSRSSNPPSRNARKSVEERRPGSTPPPNHGDTRYMSTHYVEECVEKAIDEQHVMQTFQPTLLLAVSDDALALSRFIRGYLRFKGSPDVPILNSMLRVYDEAQIYQPLGAAWDITALQGHRILLVDKVASTRVTLCQYIEQLRGAFQVAGAQLAAAGATWNEPALGVFVLQSRDNKCTAQLPEDVANGRFFVAEHIGDVHSAFSFHVEPTAPGAGAGAGPVITQA